jgi:hypothetical protein
MTLINLQIIILIMSLLAFKPVIEPFEYKISWHDLIHDINFDSISLYSSLFFLSSSVCFQIISFLYSIITSSFLGYSCSSFIILEVS